MTPNRKIKAASPPTFQGFSTETFTFLKGLKKHNNREWFLQHKDIYDEKVRGSMVELIRALEPEMKKFAPEIVVNSRSIFRIYRDIRFSQNKSPYKTHIAASFEPKGNRTESAGLYLHIEPGRTFLGGGIYHPDSAQLLAIRTYISSQYRKLHKIVGEPQFKRLFGKMQGEQLTRMPRGFNENHPAADLLRYKQYLAWKEFPEKLARTSELVPETLRYFRGMMPMIRFLNAALKNAPAKSWS